MIISRNTIQIDTTRDRLNFVLHAAAGLAILATTAICHASVYEAKLAGTALAARAAVAIWGPHIAFLRARGEKKFGGLRSDASSRKAGDVSRLRHDAEDISRKFGIASPPIIVNGTVEGETQPKLKRRKIPSYDLLKKLDNRSTAFSVYSSLEGVNRICISRQLVRDLSPAEQKSILAHELAHVAAKHGQKANVFASLTIVTVCLAMIHVLNQISNNGATGILEAYNFAVLSVIPVWLVQNSYSRKCELQADRLAALATDPRTSISALSKLTGISDKEVAPPMTGINDLFTSHPNTPKRLHVLRNIRVPTR